MSWLRPIGVFLTAAAATALVSAPAAFADGGPGGNHGGHDRDEHQVVVISGTPVVVHGDPDDNDNDEVQGAPAQSVQVEEVEPETNDVNDR